MSDRSNACTVAANRNGSVSIAAIAAIRQYVEENQVDSSCGAVVALIAAAVSCSTALAPPTTQIPSAASPSAVLAVAPAAPPPPPSRVETAPPTCPVISCLPPLTMAPGLASAPQAIATA